LVAGVTSVTGSASALRIPWSSCRFQGFYFVLVARRRHFCHLSISALRQHTNELRVLKNDLRNFESDNSVHSMILMVKIKSLQLLTPEIGFLILKNLLKLVAIDQAHTMP
jgi:hypothetical protein